MGERPVRAQCPDRRQGTHRLLGDEDLVGAAEQVVGGVLADVADRRDAGRQRPQRVLEPGGKPDHVVAEVRLDRCGLAEPSPLVGADARTGLLDREVPLALRHAHRPVEREPEPVDAVARCGERRRAPRRVPLPWPPTSRGRRACGTSRRPSSRQRRLNSTSERSARWRAGTRSAEPVRAPPRGLRRSGGRRSACEARGQPSPTPSLRGRQRTQIAGRIGLLLARSLPSITTIVASPSLAGPPVIDTGTGMRVTRCRPSPDRSMWRRRRRPAGSTPC